MKTLFRICPKLAPIGFVVSLLSFSAQAAELSSIDLKKAQKELLGFEISGRGIQPPLPFTYDGEFPRVEFEAELEASKKILPEAARHSVLLNNAFKREKLSDAELVVVVRSIRVITARLKSAEDRRPSEQAHNPTASSHSVPMIFRIYSPVLDFRRRY